MHAPIKLSISPGPGCSQDGGEVTAKVSCLLSARSGTADSESFGRFH